jgi:hypothetical protein
VLSKNESLTLTDAIDPRAKIPARMKVYPVQLRAGVLYVISMNSAQFDTYLRLESPQGINVAEDDDSGGGLNARIVYRPTQTGLHRVIATSYKANSTGAFQLTVQELDATKKKAGGGSVDPPMALGLKQPAKSAQPRTYLKIYGQPGEYISQGKNYDYPGNRLTVKKSDRGVHVQVDGFGLDLGAPKGEFLTVREYTPVTLYHLSGATAGLNFSGQGRGHSSVAGGFAVWEIEVKDNQIMRLAIDFVQRSESKGAPVLGKLRINSTFD